MLLSGCVCGGLVAVMQIVDRNSVVRATPGLALAGGSFVLLLLIQAIMFAVTMGLYALAGYLTARETGTLESGVGAGAIAGSIAGLVALALVIGSIQTSLHNLQYASALAQTVGRYDVASSAIRGLFDVVASTLTGIGAGVVGALAWRMRAARMDDEPDDDTIEIEDL
jgi:hypothetical protein